MLVGDLGGSSGGGRLCAESAARQIFNSYTFSNSLHNHKSMELWGRSRETESTWIKKIHGCLLSHPITVFKLVLQRRDVSLSLSYR